MVAVVTAQGLSKNYGSFQALQGVDLAIHEGECFGLLGPNGAGKSTLISLIYGAASRTGGSLQVLGRDPATASRYIKGELGVVTQDNQLDEAMTVVENMWHYAGFMGVPRDDRQGRIDELLAYMNLSHKRDQAIKTLSGGMQRRLVFVRALLANPKLLILDEPTTGLDPAVRMLLWDKIRALRARGMTILLTTHYMDEAERLCDRLVIMHEGRICAEGRPRELIQRYVPGYRALFAPAPALLAAFQEVYGNDPTVVVQEEPSGIAVRCASLAQATAVSERMGLVPELIRPANLEDVFLHLTGHDLQGDA